MAEYKIQGETLTAIADAIRAKTSTTKKLTPEQMASVIESVNLALQAKTVTPTTEAQEVTPDAGYYGLSKVTVEAAEAGGTEVYVAMETKSAYCDAANPNTTGAAQKNAPYCSVQIQGSNSYIYRAFLQFDLSGIPEGAHIVSAKLKVGSIEHSDNAANGTTNIARVTADWDETTLCWNNQPAFTGRYLAESVSPPSPGDWSDWDVTSLVREWVSGLYPNYGLHIVNNDEGEYRVGWRIANRLRGNTEDEKNGWANKIDIVYTLMEPLVEDIIITEHPQSVTCATGSQMSFSVSASGTNIRYQWQLLSADGTKWNGYNSTDGASSKLTLTLSSVYNGRQIRCVVSDGVGNSVASNPAIITLT